MWDEFNLIGRVFLELLIEYFTQVLMDVFDLRMFVELRVISSIIGLPYDSILRFRISSQPHVKILLIFLFTGFT